MSQPTVWRMLNKERLHSSNIQCPNFVNGCLPSARGILPIVVAAECVTDLALLTAEKSFTREVVFKVSNIPLRATANPQQSYKSTCIPKMLLYECLGEYCERFRHISPTKANRWPMLSYFSRRAFTSIDAKCSNCRS